MQRVFAKHGYAGATLERLAAEAGVNRATLHRRGVNKDDLLAQGTENYRREMWPALTGAGSGAERLGLALEALCRSTEANLGLLVALNGRTEGIFHRDEPEPLTRDVFTEPLARILADGSLREVDVTETAPCSSTWSAGPTCTCARATAGRPSAPAPAPSTRYSAGS